MHIIVSNYIKQKLIELRNLQLQLILTISFSMTVRTSGQKINKGTEDLNNTFNQIDVIDMYKTPHTMTELTLISGVQG